jgi:outer membrane lipoprotein-sorting protein
LTYYSPTEDTTDGAGKLWLHDQAYAEGTWGYSGGSEALVTQAVSGTQDAALYQRFREGSTFSHRIPLANGEYTVNLGFADMRSTGTGQRLLDVTVQGLPRETGLDAYAIAGAKTALVRSYHVVVENGELTVAIGRNAAVTTNAFLNTIEILPGFSGSNNAPLISGYSPANPVTVASGTSQQFSVEAWDADGDTLSYAWKLDGASVGSNGNAYTYSPSATEAGSHTIEVTVSDGKGGTVKQTWNVTVTAPTNQAPTVATAAKATPSPATGTTTTLSVLGADDGGEANLTYSWATTGTPPAVVAFSPNGANAAKNTTATFTKAGSYGFQVTIKDAGNLTVTSSVNVTVNQTLTAITVSPATASVNTGATQQFTATAKDQFSANLTTQPTFSWTVSGGGTISSAGLFTPGGTTAGGPYTVTATGGGKSNNATLAVNGDLVVPSVEKYRLTVNLIGGGSGVITLSPAGDVYDAGSVVTLTAVAAAGSEFADWSGDLSGTSDSATITMDADKTVSATFVLGSAAQPPKTHPLTLTKTFVRLNFGKTGSDQILVAGVLPITEGYAVEGRTLTVNFGGVEETFVLNGRGQGKTTGGEFGLRLKQKRGAVVAQQAKFQLQLKNGEFAQALSAAGLTNADSRKAAVTVPVLLTFDGTTYAVDKQLLFSAKADKMGLAK